MAKVGLTYVGKLLSNLINLIPIGFEDLKRFWGFEEELDQLRKSLAAIADLVEDAEQKQEKMVDATGWLRDLREVAYEVDDLLSELVYETTRLQARSCSSISTAINNVSKCKFRRQMSPKLKKVNLLLLNIRWDSRSLQLSSVQHNLEDMLSQNRFATDSIIDSSVVQRKTDVTKIVNLITSCYTQQHTAVVVPIVGVRGVGKTTLAKLVFRKVMSLTRKPFTVEIWVCVSHYFGEYKILKEMLRSLNASMGGLTHIDAIIRQLENELAGKRFLLVLDDVWDNDYTRWDHFKTSLSRICRNNRNAILVTTDSNNAASIMETSPQQSHQLKPISDDECWLVLKERAFRKTTKLVPSVFEVIGREIATKCLGIPSYAKVLGGILGFHIDKETWLKIRDAPLDISLDLLAVYELIFHHLPSYLKPCFLFCSIFPKDFRIRKEELIWLWMAEGIVESWDTGSECFDALLDCFIFQDSERVDYDNGILCKMHECIHYVASSLCICAIYHFYAEGRYLRGLRDTPRGAAKKLRTILASGAFSQEIWKMEMLRSLHLNGSDMSLLPSSSKKMKHLRYLDVSISKTNKLSPSITKLYNLQILNLSNSSMTELPESINKLHNLQTLNVSNSNIKELPESISKLQKLQTLDVSNSIIKELPESITELCNLQTLKFLKCKQLTRLPRKTINNLASLKHIAFSFEHQMPIGWGS